MNCRSSMHLLSPLQPWLDDGAVTDICLNSPQSIFVDRHGVFTQHHVPELTLRCLHQLSCLIAHENQKPFDEMHPILSGQLDNGFRIQLVRSPVIEGIAFALRRPYQDIMTLDDLSHQGYFSYSENPVEFSNGISEAKVAPSHDWLYRVRSGLQSGKNIVISGATGSGKTTLLNACLTEVSPDERIVILEDTREIDILHPNQLRLLTVPRENVADSITMQRLLKCCLRLRPDRIIVGELRGKEVVDFLSAAMTGHGGTITTMHAETPSMARARLCQMYKQAAVGAIKDDDIYGEIDLAVDMIIQVARTPSGRRMVDMFERKTVNQHPE